MICDPRIDAMLSQHKREMVFKLESFLSIIYHWDHIIVILKQEANNFDDDCKFLYELGFSLIPDTQNRFKKTFTR